MDKYAETAFLVILLGILCNSAIMTMRLTKIQHELRVWHKKWKVLQGESNIVREEEA